MSVPMSQVLATARTYLNDDNATQFPDAVLIPKVQEAHRELQEELWVAGSPNVRNTGIVAYTAAAVTIPYTSLTDLLCPFLLFENASGSTVNTAGWTPMTEVYNLPLGQTQSTTLGYWCWQKEVILCVGSSANRAVNIQYRSLITIPVLVTDLIGILFGESYLAARSAAIAAGTLGNADVYTAMTALAKENLLKVITANRGQQKPQLRP